MTMLKHWRPKKWWSCFLWIAATYIVAADVLPNLLLLIVNCIGYLPYSDRPGPGWQRPHLPSKEELQFFLGFAMLMLKPTAIYSTGFAIAGTLFRLCSLPRWLIRLIAALPAFLAAGLMMAGVGWMIAISSFGVYLAAGCGLVWALFIFPLLIAPRAVHLPLAARIALPTALVLSGLLGLLYPMLPRTPEAAVNVDLMRLTPGTQPYTGLPAGPFGAEIPRIVQNLNLRGDIHGGEQLMQGNSGTSDGIEALFIATQPITHHQSLNLPAHGAVVYVLAGDKWTAYPTIGKKDKRTIIIGPGNDPKYDGGTLELSTREGKAVPFSWYPGIPR
ncbi:MAG TPA: hypothetical protein VIJ79_03425 [Acidobacteriaceae bacterium]